MPIRHGPGTVLALADGRTGWWNWKDQRTADISRMTWQQAEALRLSAGMNQPDNQALHLVQKAVRGQLGPVFPVNGLTCLISNPGRSSSG